MGTALITTSEEVSHTLARVLRPASPSHVATLSFRCCIVHPWQPDIVLLALSSASLRTQVEGLSLSLISRTIVDYVDDVDHIDRLSTVHGPLLLPLADLRSLSQALPPMIVRPPARQKEKLGGSSFLLLAIETSPELKEDLSIEMNIWARKKISASNRANSTARVDRSSPGEFCVCLIDVDSLWLELGLTLAPFLQNFRCLQIANIQYA